MRGFTQDEFAQLLNYSPSFIANIESSTHQTFSVSALWRIANALGIGLHELCYDHNKLGSGNMNSVEYICDTCPNNIEMPIEVIDVFEFIYAVGKSKELYPTFTCPKCGGKLFPKNINNFFKN